MSIHERAMLVKLALRQWHNCATDDQLADEVASKYHITPRIDRYVKQLLAKAAVTELNRTAKAIRVYHNKATLPWREKGVRILPSQHFFEYQQEISRLRTTFDQAVDKFIRDYPNWVADAKRHRGATFNPAEYPDPQNLRACYAVEVSFLPFPDARDFRVDLGQDTIDQLREAAAAETSVLLNKAGSYLIQRVIEPLSALKKTLGNAKTRASRSAVAPIQNVVNMAEGLNVTNDPRVNKALAETQAFLSAPHTEMPYWSRTVQMQKVLPNIDELLITLDALLNE